MEVFAYPFLALLFVAVFTREVVAPASKNRCDKRWLVLASSMGVVAAVVTLALGALFGHLVADHALFDASARWPAPLVACLSFLVASFIFYWWHRLIHRYDLLWRLFHQLHHSARRIEALTAFYAHPLDTAAAVLISAISSYLIVGASPLAAAMALFLTGAFDIFLHSDLRTPRWIGYFLQRPEMHTLHHKREHHAQNYGLPLWDLMFGTWDNPPLRVDELGFDDDKSERVTDMLLFRDVHK